jgi:hypothetical protein
MVGLDVKSTVCFIAEPDYVAHRLWCFYKQCCGSRISRILIFYPSRISDPGFRIQQQLQKRGKNFVLHLIVATNITKFKIISFLNMYTVLKKLSKFTKNCTTF